MLYQCNMFYIVTKKYSNDSIRQLFYFSYKFYLRFILHLQHLTISEMAQLRDGLEIDVSSSIIAHLQYSTINRTTMAQPEHNNTDPSIQLAVHPKGFGSIWSTLFLKFLCFGLKPQRQENLQKNSLIDCNFSIAKILITDFSAESGHLRVDGELQALA